MIKLFEYQNKAVEFLGKKKKAYLALEMGMGKTLTALKASEIYGTKHILLIAEKNEIVNSKNFEKEVENNFPNFKYISFRDNKFDTDFLTVNPNYQRYVCGINPEGLSKLDIDFIIDNFDTVIIDESTMAKNVNTLRFKRIKKVVEKIDNLYLLSGTPMMNGCAELYAPMVLMEHPMVYGKKAEAKKAFEKIFCGGFIQKIRNTGNWYQDYMWVAKESKYIKELRYLLRDYFFIIQKKETNIFKKKTRIIKNIEMTMIWLGEYSTAWSEYYKKAKKRDVKIKNILELKRLIENGQLYQVNSKWKAKQVVKDIAQGLYGSERIVLYSMFIETDNLIKKLLEKNKISYKTFNEVDEWKKGDEQVIVGRIKAHGKGANLHEASITIFCDMDFRPSFNLQAENRIDRPQQKKDMQIIYYITEGEDVIDNHIRGINKDKVDKIEKFMQPLTDEEIKEMPYLLGELRKKYPKETNILGI